MFGGCLSKNNSVFLYFACYGNSMIPASRWDIHADRELLSQSGRRRPHSIFNAVEQHIPQSPACTNQKAPPYILPLPFVVLRMYPNA